MPITRTSSPYFSPNSAMAPALMAWSYFMTRASTATLRADLLVHQPLDLADLLGRERPVVGEVEAGLVLVHQRALLLHVVAQHFAQRRVHEVRRGVVEHGRVAQAHVHLARSRCAPSRSSPLVTTPWWPNTSAWIFCVSSTLKLEMGVACRTSTPRSPTWPPDSA